ncbi:MAG: hypothetical protein HHAS10_06070 [Candidatus Altimarinota bacterium]
MNKFLLEHIPNWKRFCEIHHPKKNFIQSFTERLELIEDEELRILVSKKINVELGILLLGHKEIDEGVVSEMLNSIQEKNES